MDEYAASIPFDYLLHEYEQYENDRAMIRSIKPSAILILFYTIIIAIAQIKLYIYNYATGNFGYWNYFEKEKNLWNRILHSKMCK